MSCVTKRSVRPFSRVSSSNSVDELPLHDGVERAGRLVGDQQLRADGERGGDRDALPLAAGEFVREVAQRARGRAGCARVREARPRASAPRASSAPHAPRRPRRSARRRRAPGRGCRSDPGTPRRCRGRDAAACPSAGKAMLPVTTRRLPAAGRRPHAPASTCPSRSRRSPQAAGPAPRSRLTSRERRDARARRRDRRRRAPRSERNGGALKTRSCRACSAARQAAAGQVHGEHRHAPARRPARWRGTARRAAPCAPRRSSSPR